MLMSGLPRRNSQRSENSVNTPPPTTGTLYQFIITRALWLLLFEFSFFLVHTFFTIFHISDLNYVNQENIYLFLRGQIGQRFYLSNNCRTNNNEVRCRS